jgi:hypothetical protein
VVHSVCFQTKKALVIGIESLTLEGGGSVEDVDLDFTLPGYPNIELKVRVYSTYCSDIDIYDFPLAWRQGCTSYNS